MKEGKILYKREPGLRLKNLISMVLIILQYGLQDVGMVIIGNKYDLERKRVVQKELGEEVGASHCLHGQLHPCPLSTSLNSAGDREWV